VAPEVAFLIVRRRLFEDIAGRSASEDACRAIAGYYRRCMRYCAGG